MESEHSNQLYKLEMARDELEILLKNLEISMNPGEVSTFLECLELIDQYLLYQKEVHGFQEKDYEA